MSSTTIFRRGEVVVVNVPFSGHAGVKSSLFLLTGIILNRYGSVDEIDLHGRVERRTLVPWLFLVGGLALSGLPPFGTSLGKAQGESEANAGGAADNDSRPGREIECWMRASDCLVQSRRIWRRASAALRSISPNSSGWSLRNRPGNAGSWKALVASWFQ